MGWSEGDELEWIENPDGTWQVIKNGEEEMNPDDLISNTNYSDVTISVDDYWNDMN